jgi:hypothetical protein
MKELTVVLVLLLATLDVAPMLAQSPKYPSLSEYMMTPETEIALARSAAPENVSEHATVKILTSSGYKVAAQGDNGFVCIVMRGWAGAPTFTPLPIRQMIVYSSKVRAPICFDPVASRTVLPYHELRAKLGMEGKDPDAIASEVAMAYALGNLPKREGVAFAYMWSADMNLGPGAGAWHPHMMIYAPYYDNSMLGGNEPGGPAPVAGDDAGTPFAVVVIPVHGIQAIKSKPVAQNQMPERGSISSMGTK